MGFLDFISSKLNLNQASTNNSTNPFLVGAKAGLKTAYNTYMAPSRMALDLGKSVVQGGASVAATLGEEVARGATIRAGQAAGVASKFLPENKTLKALSYLDERAKAVKMPAQKIPGLGFLGPIETSRTAYERRVAAGDSPLKAGLKTAGEFAVNEPLGLAAKPIFFVGGTIAKQLLGKSAQATVEAIAKSDVPEEIYKTVKNSDLFNAFKRVYKDSADTELKTVAEDLKGISDPKEVSTYIKDKLSGVLHPTTKSAVSQVPGAVKTELSQQPSTNAGLDHLTRRVEEVQGNVQKPQTAPPQTPESLPADNVAQETSIPKSTEVSTPTSVSQLEKSSLPESIPQDFNPDKYVAEQVTAREQARTAEKTGIVVKAKSFLANAKAKMVDFTAPIEDTLNAATKENGIKLKPEEDIHNQIDRAVRAPTIAGQFAKDNGIVDVIQKVDNPDALDQYLIAKHAVELDTRGITTGRNIAKDQALIKAFAPKYEPYAKVISDYSKKLLDYSVESGLISKDLADVLKARYPDYVPFERVFSELEKTSQFGGGSGVASLSKQSVVQAIEGSERAIESPLQSLLAKTNDAFKQGEKNLAGKMLAGYESLPGNPFQLKPLRTTEDVAKRVELYSEAKDLKPLQTSAGKIVKSFSRELRYLKTELNQLNRSGIKTYLKSKVEPLLPRKVSGIEIKNIPEKPATMYFDKNDFPVRGTEAVPGKTILKDELVQLNKKEAKKYIEELIQDKNLDLEAIKRKIANREPKVKELIGRLEKMREEFQSIKEKRGGLLDEARLLRDVESRGKSTISFFDNGVKNIYETTPEISQAAKALNVQQMNILGQLFALPVRIARVGITGINLPFIGANIAKDQVSAFINSSHGLATSLANPKNFVKSLFSAVKHDKLYEEMVRAGGAGTSFDIARNQVEQTVKKIRAERSITTRALYTVTHPGELLRAVEDIVARGEELTRIQQYRGTKEAMLKKGESALSATTEGARQAREATVNFARRGEWGSVLNNTFLYLNANIQGTRTLLRNLKNRPVATATKIAVSTLFPVASITAWNLSDEKRREAYKDISEYEKQNNIIIIPPNPTKDDRGRWNVIKIPLSQEVNNLVGLARRPIEAAAGLDPVQFSDFAKALLGTVSPVGSDTNSIISTALPQALKPAVQSFSNFNFFTGKQIVPESLTKLSNEKQVFPWTSGTVRQISKVIDTSPIKTEQFVKDTFGGVGAQALHYVDKVLATLGAIPKDQISGDDILNAISARFNKAQGGQGEQKTINEVKDLLTKQADKGVELKQKALKVIEKLDSFPVSEAKLRMEELKKGDPALYKKVKDLKEEQVLNLTYEDKLVKQLQVTNGERAQFIFDKLEKMSIPEQNQFMKDMLKKKIVTKDVLKQLKELKKQSMQ